MNRFAILPTALVTLCAVGGCGGTAAEHDAGPTMGMDAGHLPDGAMILIDFGPGHDGGPAVDGGCVPTFEICGDHRDQNCDGRDDACGDNDHDGSQACCPNPGTATCPYNPVCDCDDRRADVRPAVGTLPGAPELCDGVDNDCNGRVDEVATCCAGCASLMPDFGRADICTVDGACTCSTQAGATGPCPVGQTCCRGGCTDTQTDFDNCGHCNSMCTAQSDNCGGGTCRCGAGASCAAGVACPGPGGC